MTAQQQATSHIGFDRQYTLQGEHVTLWPYVRGHYPRSFLFDVWALIEKAGDWGRFFWDTTGLDTPVPTKGDIVDWVTFVETPVDQKAILVVQAVQGGEICGLVWFNRIQSDCAFGSIWMRPEYRGLAHSREAINVGLEYAFYLRGWKEVFAMTPFPLARNLVKRCGFKDVALLPNVYRIGGEPTKVHVLGIKEADYGRRG